MASSLQQTGSAPEAPWIPFVRSMYPDLLQRAHFFPPLFFNQVPHTVDSIAGQVARATVNPPPPHKASSRQRRRARQNPPPPPPAPWPSPAGAVFSDNPAGVQDEHVQDSDGRDDVAQYRCLQALRGIEEVMMVVQQMMFRKYLDHQHDPGHHINPINVISQLPSIAHPSIPLNIADGECDIIVLHRGYGILVGEVKSVGGQYLSRQSPAVQDQIVARVVTKAMTQLENQKMALKHLVHDMAGGHIRVTKTLLLPNLSTAQLTAALTSSQQLQQDLCRFTQSQTVAQAVSRCLVSDDLQRPLTWWNALWTGGPDTSMSDAVYERLVARFCGPASTVDIPTAGHPRRMLRDLGQAVAETALRFSSLVLTPNQLSLLSEHPEPRCLYLQGPPGCGKTTVLLLKALQWATRGVDVVIAGNRYNTSLTVLLEAQLGRSLGVAAAAAAVAGSVQHHLCDIGDVHADVSRLVQLLGPGPFPEAFVLFDEAPANSDDFILWLAAVRKRLPRVHVWSTGLYRRDNNPTHTPPPWLEVRTLSEPLRCPPAVTRQVETSGWINGQDIPLYSDPALPLPTEGPAVRRLQHRGHGGHDDGDPWACVTCADNVADILRELHVGQPGYPHYRDTWLICDHLQDAQSADVLVHRLCQQHSIPVSAVSCPASADEARELALADTDQVMVTDMENVQGMERTVVIALGSSDDVDFPSWSRSTSFLCIIE